MRKISYSEGRMSKYEHIKRSVRGVLESDLKKYVPDSGGKFVCQNGLIEIDFSKVNDNYCDCPLDGSDEPSTSAVSYTHLVSCPAKTTLKHHHHYKK